MAQPCKVFSYTNVGTEKGVLANIASAAQAGGWTVDKTPWTPTANCICTVRAAGTRRLFFSLRLLQAHDNAERFLLAVHGNTGFDASAAWDAQPGRFTERLAHGYCSRTTGKPIWLRTPGKYSITSTGLVDPAAGRRTDRAGLPDIRHDGDAGGLHVFRRGQYAVFGLGASDVRGGGRRGG